MKVILEWQRTKILRTRDKKKYAIYEYATNIPTTTKAQEVCAALDAIEKKYGVNIRRSELINERLQNNWSVNFCCMELGLPKELIVDMPGL